MANRIYIHLLSEQNNRNIILFFIVSVQLTKKQKESLTALGLNSLEDVFLYFPYRYEILEQTDYASWSIDCKVVLEAAVISKPRLNYYKGKNSVLYFDIETKDDQFRVTIFNRPWLAKLQIGDVISIVGKYQGTRKILAMQVSNTPLSELLGIHPVYSLKDKITEKTFNKIVDKVIADFEGKVEDFVPAAYLKKHAYLSRYEAIKNVHRPSSQKQLIQSLNTLKYEEFLRFHLLMLDRRQDNLSLDENYGKYFDRLKVEQFINNLPFKLTDDQMSAVDEILADLAAGKQMSRLLQGDVGSGKTIVAFIAMYATCLAGKQAAMMAPTEILAKQHFANLQSVFKDYDLNLALLYSSQSAKEKNEILEKLANGQIDIVVGTHSLFQSSVEYHDLGLVITDEQHRFGVKQRTALTQKGLYIDILMMSATPIPRTLASTLYGDIDVSTITQTPNKGKVIHTKLIKKNSFIPVIDEIEKLLAAGNQMYVICANIEAGNSGRNVKDIYHNLKKYFEGRYSVDLLHGQMDEQTKDDVQSKFAAGQTAILVSTTVVEVGVDVKNANIMVIYDANRFGLSQLHQLRGRVGRGEREGYCYLLTDSTDEQALQKLEIIVNNDNGFDISYYDLQLRGPGDVMGFKQSGLPDFVLGNVIKDGDILQQAKTDAIEIYQQLQQYPAIEQYLEENRHNNLINS